MTVKTLMPNSQTSERLKTPHMASVTDSAGHVRKLRTDAVIKISPCKCKRSVRPPHTCCEKKYCPCRKQGVYCGLGCACYQQQCQCTNLECVHDQSNTTVSTEVSTKKRKVEHYDSELVPEGTLTLTDEEMASLDIILDFDDDIDTMIGRTIENNLA